jgi:hypothetical protein
LTRPVRSSLPAPIARITALSATDYVLLCAAVAELARARLHFERRPILQIIDRLRTARTGPAGAQAKPIARRDLERVRWAVAAAAQRVPWRSDCLIQVMAADRLLRRAGAGGEFHLGVAKSPVGSLCAHAWLSSGGVVVAGGSGEGFMALLEPRTGAERLQGFGSK